jgi:hypothetical protein
MPARRGAWGVAVVSGITDAPDVEAAARRYRHALDAPAKAPIPLADNRLRGMSEILSQAEIEVLLASLAADAPTGDSGNGGAGQPTRGASEALRRL